MSLIQLMQLAAGFSLYRPGFEPKAVHEISVVGKVGLWLALLSAL
jgi:hypothetical protein